MDDPKKTVIRRWVVKADHDLLTAQTMIGSETPPTDVICFHCQQCAEKMLKAFLVLLDIHVEKTHDLVRLLAQCVQHDPMFGGVKDAAETLNSYAVDVRYADDWRDIPLDEAREAVKMAERVMSFVRPKLGLADEEPENRPG
jgi:HEPN domain-containing protein